MKCIIPDSAHDNDHKDNNGHVCPDVYCPPSSKSPNNGNYTASSCIFTEFLNSTDGSFNYKYYCPTRDFCSMTCTEINADGDNFVDTSLYKSAVRGSITYACSSGNLTGNVTADRYEYWDQNPIPSLATKTNLSLVLPIVLLMLYLPYINKLFRN